jgi:hypothetical protein
MALCPDDEVECNELATLDSEDVVEVELERKRNHRGRKVVLEG